jgi:hypothetical protein
MPIFDIGKEGAVFLAIADSRLTSGGRNISADYGT